MQSLRFLRRATAAAVLLGSGIGALAACEPPIATFTVDVVGDAPDSNVGDGICAVATGGCTLRAAIQEGNAEADPGVVQVTLGTGLFSLTINGAVEDLGATGDLDLHRPFRILGQPGPPPVFGSGGTGSGIFAAALFGQPLGDRVFDVHDPGRLELDGVQIVGDSALGESGGVIRSPNADLAIRRTVLTGSEVFGAGRRGAAIEAPGAAVVMSDTAISNMATPAGSIGGAVVADRVEMVRTSIVDSSAGSGSALLLLDPAATSIIQSSTFSGTVASAGSGIVSAGSVNLRDVTLTASTAPGGFFNAAGTVAMINSIVAGQTSGPDCGSPVVSLGSNLESGTSCGFTGPGDIQSTDPHLGPETTIGFVSVRMPSGGAAIESGANCLPTDATGAARPIDTDGDGTAVCERGAVERTPFTIAMAVDSAADAVDADPGDALCASSAGQCTVRAAVMEANAWPGSDSIAIPFGSTYGLTIAGADEDAGATGDLDITESVTITGTGTGLALLDGNDLDRVLDIRAGTVALTNLRVSDGTAPTGGGGAIRTALGTSVSLTTSEVTASVAAAGAAGGGILMRGAGTLTRSTLRSNTATTGGGLSVFGSAVTITESTVSGNTASVSGSGIGVSGGSSNVAIVSSTVSHNNTTVGISVAGTVTARNTIVSNHPSNVNCSAATTTLGRNLESGSTCGFVTGTDMINTDPALGALATNGGLTLNRLPGVGSFAIGTGECVTNKDQRNVNRPQGGACDRGSTEQ